VLLLYKLRFNILRLIPISVPVNPEYFLYIDLKDEVLCIDQAEQFLYGNSVAGNTSVQLTRDLLLQIDFKHACSEDLGVTLNFSQMSADMTLRKAVFRWDDLKLTSTFNGCLGQPFKV